MPSKRELRQRAEALFKDNLMDDPCDMWVRLQLLEGENRRLRAAPDSATVPAMEERDNDMDMRTFPDYPTTDCALCGKPTISLSTKRCDGCWELEHRIHDNPELARKILDAFEKANREER